MENEIEIKLVFWIGTLMMVLLTVCIILITLLYHRKVLLIQARESENLLKTILDTEQKERRRIASDLHDSVNGDIGAIRNFVAIITSKEEDDYKSSILRHIQEALDQTSANLQMISYNLMPPLLESLGITAVLKDYFDKCRKWSKINITDTYSHDFIDLPVEKSFELFRIVQEVFNNLFKHSRATQVSISVEWTGHHIFLKIQDNGIPFNFKEQSQKSSGMGLKNIISRTKQIHAEFQQSSSESGNEVLLQINTG